MRPRELHRRVAAALFVLVALAAKLVDTANSEEPIFSQLDSNQNISLDSEFKSQASKDETSPEQQNWLFHVQGTEIAQGQPGFHSPYHGPNSLLRADTFRQTSSLDIYLGARLWPGGEFYVNPEYFQGFGLSNTHGIAAFPNAEAYKVGQKIGDVFNAHMFLRQTFGFGGEQEDLASDQLQFADRVDISRLTFTIGRLSVGDQFDANAYAHSPLVRRANLLAGKRPNPMLIEACLPACS